MRLSAIAIILLGLCPLVLGSCQTGKEPAPNSPPQSNATPETMGTNTANAPTTAPDSGGAPEAPIVDPKAQRILKEMSEYLTARNQFSVHVEISQDDFLPTGQKIQLEAVNDVAVMRPNRFFSEYRGDSDNKRYWYDGKTVTLLDPENNIYAQAPGAGTIDATLDAIMKNYGFSPPLSDLLYSDPYAVLSKDILVGLYLGKSEIREIPCHHLAFVGKNADWQIWIEDGKTWVPRKVVITYKTMPASPQFSAILSDWDFTTPLALPLFTPEIPAGAIATDFLPLIGKK